MEAAERTAELREKYTDFDSPASSLDEAHKITRHAKDIENMAIERFVELVRSDETLIKLPLDEIWHLTACMRDTIKDGLHAQVQIAKKTIKNAEFSDE